MVMPRPSAGHANLEMLAGYWEGVETMYPSQWDPNGGTATGRTSSRIALQGFALISDYEQERDGLITFSGHGVYTFDPKRELYTLHWFDCIGSPPEVFQGRFVGTVLTLAHGGPGMHARLVYDFTDAQHLKSSMAMSRGGVDWNKMFEGSYEKKQG